MTPITPHLGARVSALLDGRLRPDEEERCWAHVHACHPCRDLVEREGWVKTRLASWGHEPGSPSDRLKSSLLEAAPWPEPSGAGPSGATERSSYLVSGGVAGAVGVAVVGVIALGVGPAAPPTIDRRAPVTDLTRTSSVSWLEGPSMRASRGALDVGASTAVGPLPDTRTGTWSGSRGTMGR